jgi:hypothetical protein
MKTPNTIEQEINRVRLEIYEETKDMTAAQRAERTNQIAFTAAQKYGFKIVASNLSPSRKNSRAEGTKEKT